MTAAALRDKVAAKVRNMASVDQVYGNGSTDATAPVPGEVLEYGISAIVWRGSTTHEGGNLSGQLIDRIFEVEFVLSGRDKGEAERWVDKLDDELLTEFSTGITLGGSARDTWYTGSDRPVENTEGDLAYYSWLARVTVRERNATEVTA